jgi:Skp family chaperone for outer membrane proteins
VKAQVHLSLGYLVLLAAPLGLAVTSAIAQNPPGAPTNPAARQPAAAARPASIPPGTVVAVLDISYVFENHAGFKQAMDKMKQEVQQYEEKLRADNVALTKERDQLQQFKAGSQEYERLERSLADRAAKLQIDMQMKKREFLTRESKVYYEVYQEVSNAVREFAEMKGIDLVLRYNADEMNPDDRTSVLQGVNKPVIFHRNLDITREILDRLNRTPQVSQRPPVRRQPAAGTR